MTHGLRRGLGFSRRSAARPRASYRITRAGVTADHAGGSHSGSRWQVSCRYTGDTVATREITTHSAEETIAFGRTLGDILGPPKLVLLRGDLGAGKTTLVKGIAQAFQAASEEDVTSPTFTLIHEYHGPGATLYHIDLYRIDTARELQTLALDDLVASNSILLIEWGEKFSRFQQERDVEIQLDRLGENDRRIRLTT